MNGIEGLGTKTILIVDDEQPIVDMLVYNLRKEGYKTLEANDGIEGINLALKNKPDLILLDIMLPKMDGLTVCKKIRSKYNIPILMLSAKDEEIDKILGLELGADDYITKPFSIRELMARVKANLRKTDMKQEEQEKIDFFEDGVKIIDVGPLSLNLEKIEATINNKPIYLTLKEFDVLKYLARHKGQVVTREHLLEKVWEYEYYGDIRNVDVTVRRIRKKIEEQEPGQEEILATKRGIGYYLKYQDIE